MKGCGSRDADASHEPGSLTGMAFFNGYPIGSSAGFSPDAALMRAIRLTEHGQAERAFPLLTEAARAGIAEAEFRVGRCYLEGVGVPASRARRPLAAARREPGLCGSPGAAGDALHSWHRPRTPMVCRPAPPPICSTPTPLCQPDFVAAERWARRAADGGSADGQALLGYILTSGPENQRNLDEALHWYETISRRRLPAGALGYALSLARGGTTPNRRPKSPSICGGRPRPAWPRRCFCSE